MAVVTGGLTAGALDIIYACSVSYWANGVSPVQVLQYIAGGVLGLGTAMQGGLPIALLGLALHFAMTLAMAAIFVAAARRVPLLQRWPIAAGVVYGLATWLVMTFVVVPLSAIGPQPLGQDWQMVGQIAAHIFLVGIPIALAARTVPATHRHGFTAVPIDH